ncbi:hypothetical protein KUTeg_008424 [Tegillarca granosa]|uniref:Uncharacterized protein n=1 Tax=Tegillarca granosa TaxID=220873 RepID=A0ABQ9F928_TEGGR|nr:hypothetical protein KUTeg_008424 [Tegillarca granosa]
MFNIFSDSTSLMYETDDLREASPATVSRCTVVHFSSETTHWSSVFECWVRTAKSRWVITTAGLRIWEDLVRDIFGPTIKFLKNECSTALLTDVGHFAESANEVAPGIQEVTTFIRFLSALLDKALLRDEVEKKSEMEGKNEDYW